MVDQLTPGGHESDAALAARIAVGAGGLLLHLRAQLGHGDPDRLRAAGDRQAHEHLAAALAASRPADAVLSEEAPDDLGRLAADRVWIVDPLDGTREYGEPGRTDWAVHVALWQRGELVAGAVALPGQGRLLRSDAPAALPPARSGPPRAVVSRTRPGPAADALVARVGAELVPLGSAGAKVAAVVLGEAEIYAHSGGQREWDSAAPVAVALAAGLHASRLDGAPLVYNRRDVTVPDLLVCRKELAAAAVAALRDVG